jgi:NAD+ diphosphatase
MSSHIAYLFQGQNLVVDADLQLPVVEADQHDLFIEQAQQTVLVRDIQASTPLPEGFHLVAIRELIMYWDSAQFEQAAKAKQLLEWRRNHRFCSHCGSKTQTHHSEFAMVCPQCHYHQYPRIQPCIITLITHQAQILLAKANRPHNDMYGLIAGFVEVGETLEQAVQREVAEEVGIKVKNISYLASQPWPFPSNLMIAFHAEYDSGDLKLQPEEIADAQFFAYHQLPKIPTAGSIAHKMIKAAVHNLSLIYAST